MMDKLLDKIKASPKDSRDYIYQSTAADIPEQVDLRAWDSLVESQGSLGSCASGALTNCYELMVKRQYPDKFVELSRLFNYYQARLIEGTLNEDLGVAYLRSVLQAAKKYGICREELWPYRIDKFTVEPTPECYADALNHVITEYRLVLAQTDMLEALNQGHPLLIGMEIYNDFYYIGQDDPVVSMPDENLIFEGGHAVAVIGYDLKKRQFLLKNSFGTGWGARGYAWLPFEYERKYVFERWAFDINDQNVVV